VLAEQEVKNEKSVRELVGSRTLWGLYYALLKREKAIGRCFEGERRKTLAGGEEEGGKYVSYLLGPHCGLAKKKGED